MFEFVEGFTVACDYVDVIDVGEGGSKADRKLLGQSLWVGREVPTD